MTKSVLDGDGSLDFRRLALLCERVGTLPPLPRAALDLIRTIDRGEASVAHLENVISRDIGLTTEVLRVASERLCQDVERLSLRNAIATLGFVSVRSLGLSMALHGAIAQDAGLGPLRDRISSCGFFVGQASRFMFARLTSEEERRAGLSVDEVYAMGVLCNLGVSLLAKLDPHLLAQTIDYAQTSRRTLHASFFSLHGRHIGELGALAARTWGLPDAFVSSQSHLTRPEARADEILAWSCVAFAHEIAELYGVGLCDWPVSPEAVQTAGAEVGIAPQEIEILIGLLKGSIDAALLERSVRKDEQSLRATSPLPIEDAANVGFLDADGSHRRLRSPGRPLEPEAEASPPESESSRLDSKRGKRPYCSEAAEEAEAAPGVERPRLEPPKSLGSAVLGARAGTPSADLPDAAQNWTRYARIPGAGRFRGYRRAHTEGSSREGLVREVVSLVRERGSVFADSDEAKVDEAPPDDQGFLTGVFSTTRKVLRGACLKAAKILEW